MKPCFQYVELHARSAFSFLEGTSLPELLMARCAELEIPAMALLDRNGLYGSPRLHLAAQRAGLRAHVGAEIAVKDAGDQTPRETWGTSLAPWASERVRRNGCRIAFLRSRCAGRCWLRLRPATKTSAA